MEAPEYLRVQGACFDYPPERRHSDVLPADQFVVDDLLDFPNEDLVADCDGSSLDAALTGSSSNNCSTLAVVDSCNSSFSEAIPPSSASQFAADLSVPYDELAELEWLSNFAEESFSSEDLEKLRLISGMKPPHADEASGNHQFHDETDKSSPMFVSEMSVPAKARSKRSRAAPCNWTSRLLLVSRSPFHAPSGSHHPLAPASSSSESDVASSAGRKVAGKVTPRKKEATDNASAVNGGEGRRCLHCATDKTPQWRTGPMGPKTLCNACGVRYKSGRLVDEYRPAASPTFVLTKHSNSHRKVMEIRRQKDLVRAQHQHHLQQHHQQFIHQSMMLNAPNNGDDYLIHHHIGHNFRQMM